MEFWVRNLFENDEPIAAFRDIYWTNTDDMHGTENPAHPQEASNFDDFPPLRMSVTYPTLRTYGLHREVPGSAAPRNNNYFRLGGVVARTWLNRRSSSAMSAGVAPAM